METSKISNNQKNSAEVREFLRAFEKGTGKPGGRWVLIVDDEPAVRRVVARSMVALDTELIVHEAENGREALDTLQSTRESSGNDPVLIVTDLQMPVMDGWQFIEQLRKDDESKGRTKGIPVIVLSASSGEKGLLFKQSVHGDKSKYTPLVTVAKEDCIKPMKYDSKGEKGLAAWVEYFLR